MYSNPGSLLSLPDKRRSNTGAQPSHYMSVDGCCIREPSRCSRPLVLYDVLAQDQNHQIIESFS
ncbi:hypothetical protein E2C01_028739 [Portunus trituberculatus]|uniref:Uncharacterized protein n=1 Tax=Portunus trituberculatus TaxID=210409 RepID=A0A5B7EPW5_PORTR|nr:hypothetical protein [Portunus trituberculatus]